MKRPLNNQKSYLFNEKIAKSSVTFRKNKPNFKNIEIGVTSFKTGKYEILTAWRSQKQTQSNPIQTQCKPNPGKAENEPKKCYKNELQRFYPDGVKKTNPNKAKADPILSSIPAHFIVYNCRRMLKI